MDSDFFYGFSRILITGNVFPEVKILVAMEESKELGSFSISCSNSVIVNNMLAKDASRLLPKIVTILLHQLGSWNLAHKILLYRKAV